MLRYQSLEEISDGKLYDENDMVRADCRGCEGCSSCCRGMGESIVLDPLDVFRLTTALSVSFEQLLTKQLEFHVVDGVVLPNLKMSEDMQACVFLNQDGRCMIHASRPGICRIFPLGRYWEGEDFRYILQAGECRKKNRSKVKVKDWLDVENRKENRSYLQAWHSCLQKLRRSGEIKQEGSKGGEAVGESAEETLKNQNVALLQLFFITPYDAERDFYEQFYERLR